MRTFVAFGAQRGPILFLDAARMTPEFEMVYL